MPSSAGRARKIGSACAIAGGTHDDASPSLWSWRTRSLDAPPCVGSFVALPPPAEITIGTDQNQDSRAMDVQCKGWPEPIKSW